MAIIKLCKENKLPEIVERYNVRKINNINKIEALFKAACETGDLTLIEFIYKRVSYDEKYNCIIATKEYICKKEVKDFIQQKINKFLQNGDYIETL